MPKSRQRSVKLPVQMASHLLVGIWIYIQILSTWCSFDQDENEPCQLHLGGRVSLQFDIGYESQKEMGGKRKVWAQKLRSSSPSFQWFCWWKPKDWCRNQDFSEKSNTELQVSMPIFLSRPHLSTQREWREDTHWFWNSGVWIYFLLIIISPETCLCCTL